jgi:heme/copper-type cytochrome/quinol oxidase subunit 3
MAQSTAAIPIRRVPVPKRPRFGDGPPDGGGREAPVISNARLAVLILLAGETMLFAGFIGSFIVFKFSAPFWPPPGLPRLPIAVTWVNTFVLLLSGVTMNIAVRAIRRNRIGQLRLFLGLTALLGTTFLAVQGSEWVRLIAHGLHLSSGTYGATFYTLIGLHGFHVLCAVIWLLGVFVAALMGKFSAFRHSAVEICAIYWYFVCAVWPVLFYLVYF